MDLSRMRNLGVVAHIDAGGNLPLYDVNGDRGVNASDAISLLHYLFGGGAPPALGRECVRIRGCPDLCER